MLFVWPLEQTLWPLKLEHRGILNGLPGKMKKEVVCRDPHTEMLLLEYELK